MEQPESNGAAERASGSLERMVRCVGISNQLLNNLNVQKRLHGDRWPEVMADLGTALQLHMKTTGETNAINAALPIARKMSEAGENPMIFIAVATELANDKMRDRSGAATRNPKRVIAMNDNSIEPQKAVPPPATGSAFLEKPERDGAQWENQCARCGSSMHWEDCESCDENGMSGHDCGEDCCCCLDPEENMICDTCDGEGGWWICLSDDEWCHAHPLPGREHVQRGRVEWFRMPNTQGVARGAEET